MMVGKYPFSDQTQIVRKPLEFKNKGKVFLSKEGKDFLNKILEKNPKFRLGSGKTGSQEIKDHPWFSNIDFEALYKKKVITFCSNMSHISIDQTSI